MTDFVTPDIHKRIYTHINSLESHAGDIEGLIGLNPDSLGQHSGSTSGTVELVDFTDSELYIQSIHLSFWNGDAAEQSAYIKFDPDSGSDVIFPGIKVSQDQSDNIQLSFFPHYKITTVGDIDLIFSGTDVYVYASVFGNIVI